MRLLPELRGRGEPTPQRAGRGHVSGQPVGAGALAALQGLLSALAPEVAPGVKDALAQLDGLKIVAGPDPTTPPPAVDTSAPLKVASSLDPVCGTVDGSVASPTTTAAVPSTPTPTT